MENVPIPRKASFRDSFLNMLGEFVALNKTPDFKPNSQSNQYLADAIRGEIQNQRKRMNIPEEWITQREPKHFRTSSTNSACQKTSKKEKELRRHSVPGHAQQQNEDVARSTVASRRQRFFNRFRRL